MALPKLFDRVRMTISGTPGTGDVLLGSAIATAAKGYHQSFAAAGAGNGDIARVCFEDGSAWEISDVVYFSAVPTLQSRSLVASSTGSLLSLTSAAEVFTTPTAAWLQGLLDKSQNLADVASAATAFANIKQGATTSATGVSELATDSEAQAKSDTARVLTCSNLAALAASLTFAGLVELATAAEYRTGTDTGRALVVSEVWSAALNATLTDGANIAVDLGNGWNFGGSTTAKLNLGGNRALSAPSNTKGGQTGVLWFGASSSTRTLTLNAAWNLLDGVETGPYSITTSQTLGLCYVVLGSTVYVTAILRIG